MEKSLGLRVVKATDLPSGDFNGKSDPYVIITHIRSKELIKRAQTKVINETLNPEWNESFVFDRVAVGDSFEFQVMDRDKITKDDELCTLKINVSDLPRSGEDWLELTSSFTKRVPPKLLLSWEWYGESSTGPAKEEAEKPDLEKKNVSLSPKSSPTLGSWVSLTAAQERIREMIRFAPIDLPVHRRRQTFAVLVFALLLPFSVGLTLFMLAIPKLWVFIVPYLIWILVIDRKTPSRGGRRSDYVRRMLIWKWFVDYFPIKLHKECDLDPKKNYLFGYHPHGIISLGAFGNFASEATGFSDLFPGITLRLLTLTTNFKIPFARDILLSLGLCDVSKESLNYILSQGPGSSAMIVIGGAAESLDAHPGTYDLTILNRKGFVKIALTRGANLVPVFSFGETDVYDMVPNPRGSLVRNIQDKTQKILGFAIPLFHGRGVFQYTFGLLPKRTTIHTVVGAPIDLPKIENPTQEDIDKYHQAYMDAIKKLFDTYKNNMAMNRKQSLRFVQ